MDQNNISNITNELEQANGSVEIETVIKEWYEKIHTQSLKLGAKYISAAIMGAMQKHLHKEGKVTLRDYKRMTDDISKIIAVPIKKQEKVKEEVAAEAVDAPVTEVVEEKEITNE